MRGALVLKSKRALKSYLLVIRSVLVIVILTALPLSFSIAESLPEVPANLTAFATQVYIITSWNPVSGADGYELEIDNGAESILLEEVSYLHTGLEQASEHTYRVRARNAAGTSDWSEPLTVLTLQSLPEADEPGLPEPGDPAVPGENEYLLPPNSIGTLPEDTNITISWSAVEGAEGYEVEIDGALVTTTVQAVYFRYEGLEPDTRHSYKVRTVKGEARSEWSPEVPCRTLLSAPENLCAESGRDSITLTWTTTPVAVAYEVEIDGAATEMAVLAEYRHSGLSAGETHTYRVRACGKDNIGVWSSIIEASVLKEINYSANCMEGREFNLILTSSGIDNYEGNIFCITYNNDELEVADLCAQTSGFDLTAGEVPGTGITIISSEPGKIVFTSSKKNDVANKPLAILDKIRFRAKTSCTSSLIFIINNI